MTKKRTSTAERDELLQLHEAAEAACVTRQTISLWVKAGVLPPDIAKGRKPGQAGPPGRLWYKSHVLRVAAERGTLPIDQQGAA